MHVCVKVSAPSCLSLIGCGPITVLTSSLLSKTELHIESTQIQMTLSFCVPNSLLPPSVSLIAILECLNSSAITNCYSSIARLSPLKSKWSTPNGSFSVDDLDHLRPCCFFEVCIWVALSLNEPNVWMGHRGLQWPFPPVDLTVPTRWCQGWARTVCLVNTVKCLQVCSCLRSPLSQARSSLGDSAFLWASTSQWDTWGCLTLFYV